MGGTGVIVVSAQQLLTTRNCAAERCERDAEPNSRLCWRCAQRDSVRLHTTPKPTTEPMLQCCTCHAWKPDDAFTKQATPKAKHRRHRNAECKPCSNQRRRRLRQHQHPKIRCQATNHSRKTRHQGHQCLKYVTPGTPYCSTHQPKADS